MNNHNIFNQFIELKVESAKHAADGIFYLEFQDDKEIFINGRWFLTTGGLLKATNFLVLANEQRKNYMKRVEKTMFFFNDLVIKDIKISFDLVNPCLEIAFSEENNLIVFGIPHFKAFPSFHNREEKNSFDWDKGQFVVQKNKT
jgi:hypothetical protein